MTTPAIPWTESDEFAIGENDLLGRPDTDNRPLQYVVQQSGWDPQSPVAFPGFVVTGQAASVSAITAGNGITVSGDVTNSVPVGLTVGPFTGTYGPPLNVTYQNRMYFDNWGSVVVEGYDNSHGGWNSQSFVGKAAGGTFAAPTYPDYDGDQSLVNISGEGWYAATNTWLEGGGISILTYGPWSATNVGTRMIFWITPPNIAPVGNYEIRAATLTSASWSFAVPIVVTASAVNGRIGISVGDTTGTSAFAIKTGLGVVEFGDGLGVGDAGAAVSAAGLQITRLINPLKTVAGGGQYGILVNVKGTQVGGAGSFTAGMHMQMFADANSVGNLWAIRVGMPQLSGNVNITDFRGLDIDGAVTGGIGTGTISTAYGVYINPINAGSVNNYGIFIGDVTGTGAYAIKTGAGLVQFGGNGSFGTGGSGPVGAGPNALLTVVGATTINSFQYGVYAWVTASTSAVNTIAAFQGTFQTTAGAQRAIVYLAESNNTIVGTVGDVIGFAVGLVATNTLTGGTNNYGLRICTISGGTSNYGIWIGDVTTNTAYAIYTNAGLVRFGGALIIGTDPGGGQPIRGASLGFQSTNAIPVYGGMVITTSTLGVSSNNFFVGTDAGASAVSISGTGGLSQKNNATVYGILCNPTPSATAPPTTAFYVSHFQVVTPVATFTLPVAAGVHVADASLGTGTTLTLLCGLLIDNLTKGTSNIGVNIGSMGGSVDSIALAIQQQSLGTQSQFGIRIYGVAGAGGTTGGAILIDGVTRTGTTNNYGVKIGDVTGTGSNYAIFTGLGTVRFGDTLLIDTFNGATAVNRNYAFQITQSIQGTGSTNYGVQISPTSNAPSTEFGGIRVQPATKATTFTVATAVGIRINDFVKGAGSTITAQYGLYIDSQTQGATNYAILTNAGLVQFGDNVNIVSGKVLQVNALQVVAARKTGWATWTGTANRATKDTAGATLTDVAQTLKALIDDLHATAGHGLIGT